MISANQQSGNTPSPPKEAPLVGTGSDTLNWKKSWRDWFVQMFQGVQDNIPQPPGPPTPPPSGVSAAFDAAVARIPVERPDVSRETALNVAQQLAGMPMVRLAADQSSSVQALIGQRPNPPVPFFGPAAVLVLGTDANGTLIAAPLADTQIWIGGSDGLPHPFSFTGDVTLSDAGLTVVIKVNGAAVPASATVAATNASRQIIAAGLADGEFWLGNGSNLPVAVAMSQDATMDDTGKVTLATVNASPGTYGDSTHVAQVTVNGKGLDTTVTNVAIAFPGTTGFTGTLAAAIAGGKNVTNGLIDA